MFIVEEQYQTIFNMLKFELQAKLLISMISGCMNVLINQ